jgi:hypothetical protein
MVGRDQTGRRFPSDRLVLASDARDCRSILDVDERAGGVLHLRARAAEGRCQLALWSPGNLNFEWVLEVEISPGARTTYTRGEAETIVTALYRATLGREPDDGGYGSAVQEVQTGNLDALIESMIRSQEFRGREPMDAGVLLEQFYGGVFDRRPDSGGVRLYLNELQQRRYADVLLKLIQSPEFERVLEPSR